MSNIDDGGLAFPINGNDVHASHPGMSLRDYFAARAMQAFCPQNNITYRTVAEMAYRQADAMLEARKV
jgi:hypothetical protein